MTNDSGDARAAFRIEGEQDRPLRTPPYHDRQAAKDAVFHENNGWAGVAYYGANEELAGDYDVPDGVAESNAIGVEHLATRATVGCYDLTPHVPVEIRGPAAGEFVKRTFTNDMQMAVGAIRFALLLADDGGILGDLIVTRLSDQRYLAVANPAATRAVAWLRNHAPSDVTVIDHDSAYVAIGLWGPAARTVAQSLTETDLSNDAFPFLSTQELQLGGVPVTAMRLSAVGELGWELWAPTEYGLALWEALWSVGADHGMVGLGDRAFISLSGEKGNREWGNDMTAGHNPYETGLDFAVDMDTDFVGKDALERIVADGVDQQIACLTLDRERHVPAVGSAVLADGEVVGAVVRSEYGYTIDKGIAFSYLPVEYTTPGTTVETDADGRRYAATVQEDPLFDEANERMLQ